MFRDTRRVQGSTETKYPCTETSRRACPAKGFRTSCLKKQKMRPYGPVRNLLTAPTQIAAAISSPLNSSNRPAGPHPIFLMDKREVRNLREVSGAWIFSPRRL